jgi:hypothetical protein
MINLKQILKYFYLPSGLAGGNDYSDLIEHLKIYTVTLKRRTNIAIFITGLLLLLPAIVILRFSSKHLIFIICTYIFIAWLINKSLFAYKLFILQEETLTNLIIKFYYSNGDINDLIEPIMQDDICKVIRLLNNKIIYLEKQKATTADPSLIFDLTHKIEHCHEEIKRLRNIYQKKIE